MDLQTEMARIANAQAELRAYCAEMRAPVAAPWPLLIVSMAVGATLFGGGMVFAKLIGV